MQLARAAGCNVNTPDAFHVIPLTRAKLKPLLLYPVGEADMPSGRKGYSKPVMRRSLSAAHVARALAAIG